MKMKNRVFADGQHRLKAVLKKTETREQYFSRLEQANQLFWAQPKSKRAVIIAKDVLACIRVGKVKASVGFEPELTLSASAAAEAELQEERGSAQPVLLDEDTKCEACALGNMMFCHVARGNEFPGNQLDIHQSVYGGSPYGQISTDGEDILEKLSAHFKKKDLAMIETAYEGLSSFIYLFEHGDGCYHDQDYIKSTRYLENLNTILKARFGRYSNELLAALMLNVIHTKGSFDPSWFPTKSEIATALGRKRLPNASA